jgi:RsiW-degrading membrane proteinase PrsW (M82 family)
MAVAWLMILAVAPALFWLWWFYRKDRLDPEPRGLVLKIFFLGMLPVIPAGLIEIILFQLIPGLEGTTLIAIVLSNLLVIGPLEEFGKYLVVKRWALRHPAFNEPLDGIVYAAASALGFAAFENFFYLLDNGAWLILLRGPLSTLDHVLFSALWGYALGMATMQTDPGAASRLVRNGLVLASLGHGASNILLMAPQAGAELIWSPLLAILLAVVLYKQVSRNIVTSLAASPLQLTARPGDLGHTDEKRETPA